MIIKELEKILLDMGLKNGNIICVHSDITSFGIPNILKDKVRQYGFNIILDSYIDTFKSVVGMEGLVLMPTFSYSATKGEIFYVNETKSDVGSMTDYFRTKKNVYRSHHPIFSFAAWGNNAEEYLHLCDYDCFGMKSIFGKIYDMNAKYVLFGLSIPNGLSAVYFSEQRVNAYYRYFKEIESVINDGHREYKKKIKYFVRDKKLNYRDSWYNLEKKALEQEIAINTQYNGGKIFIIQSQRIDDLIIGELKKNKDFLIVK